jgi:hypothetical protein
MPLQPNLVMAMLNQVKPFFNLKLSTISGSFAPLDLHT